MGIEVKPLGKNSPIVTYDREEFLNHECYAFVLRMLIHGYKLSECHRAIQRWFGKLKGKDVVKEYKLLLWQRSYKPKLSKVTKQEERLETLKQRKENKMPSQKEIDSALESLSSLLGLSIEEIQERLNS